MFYTVVQCTLYDSVEHLYLQYVLHVKTFYYPNFLVSYSFSMCMDFFVNLILMA